MELFVFYTQQPYYNGGGGTFFCPPTVIKLFFFIFCRSTHVRPSRFDFDHFARTLDEPKVLQERRNILSTPRLDLANFFEKINDYVETQSALKEDSKVEEDSEYHPWTKRDIEEITSLSTTDDESSETEKKSKLDKSYYFLPYTINRTITTIYTETYITKNDCLIAINTMPILHFSTVAIMTKLLRELWDERWINTQGMKQRL